jgi:RNA polymerase sigma-70 factor (ECF subfamily)
VKEAAEKVYERLLILRCQTGDPAALAELIARYSPGLRLFIAKLGAGSAADDLLQDTWFDVYRKLHALQRPEAFAAWIYRIARDKVYRQHRRRRLPHVTIEQDVGALCDDVEDEPFTAEDAELVRIAMDDLSLELREILLLRFVEAMSYEQIAEVVGRPVGTVRSRLHYAKLALRTKLQSRIL